MISMGRWERLSRVQACGVELVFRSQTEEVGFKFNLSALSAANLVHAIAPIYILSYLEDSKSEIS